MHLGPGLLLGQAGSACPLASLLPPHRVVDELGQGGREEHGNPEQNQPNCFRSSSRLFGACVPQSLVGTQIARLEKMDMKTSENQAPEPPGHGSASSFLPSRRKRSA